jgi:TRAP-type uncharacterized transport system substrate-binding protein
LDRQVHQTKEIIMKTIKTFIAVSVVALVAFPVVAQEQFRVATGSQTLDKVTNKPTSTYTWMFRDINQVCQAALPMTEVGSNGSPQNVEFLTSKEVNGAFVQGDLLAYMDQTDPAKVANIKTVFALAPEELHFIARADVKKEGGVTVGGYNIGGNAVQFKTLADLAGRKVGAVGGSILSGRVVAKQSGLNFQMVDAGSNDALVKGLLDGTYDAVLVVAGQPSGLVKTLDQRYRILPVSQETAEKLTAYTKATLSYGNLNQAGVPTVATQALFVSRVFRDPDMLARLSKLRTCFQNNVYKLQDANGTHPKWADVDPKNNGKWAYYDLPAAK